MFLFLKFLLAHILGDFIFQSEKWVKDKEEKKIKSLKLYFHICIHALLLFSLLQFNLQEYWLGFLIIVLSHFIFDVSKLYLQKKKTKRNWFFMDQFLHVLVLFFTTLIYTGTNFTIENVFNDQILILSIALLLVTQVSAIVIKVIITQWSPESKNENDDSLAKAGRYIGVLERLFVFVFVVTNHWEAIGFLLAAKSVFRFGDLTSSKDRKLTEYILIGTLLSFGLAIIIGILYSYLKSII
ncbi:MAG: protein-S-isoprenylcysteine O-methyltransferase Ste14 [Polaribacter sp.]|jgi:protein-S-isoprenylcysteine O-methyltransferase Ste14